MAGFGQQVTYTSPSDGDASADITEGDIASRRGFARGYKVAVETLNAVVQRSQVPADSKGPFSDVPAYVSPKSPLNRSPRYFSCTEILRLRSGSLAFPMS